MTSPLSAAAIATSQAHRVRINPDAIFGFPGPKETLLESPTSIRRGIYDVDFVGAYSYMGGRETFIRHVSSIGRFCSIASNVTTGQVEHPTDFLSASPVLTGFDEFGDLSGFYDANREMVGRAATALGASMANRIDKIHIGNDVWIGEGVFIRRGVRIGDGAILAARSVITRDLPPYAIVAGVPAKVIRLRFEPKVVEELLGLSWWNLSALTGVDFTDIRQAISMIGHNIASQKAQLYGAPLINIGADGQATAWRYDIETNMLVDARDMA